MAEKAVEAGHIGQLTHERAMRRHVRRDGAKECEVGPIEPHTMNPSWRSKTAACNENGPNLLPA
jgi:hypothetical protein